MAEVPVASFVMRHIYKIILKTLREEWTRLTFEEKLVTVTWGRLLWEMGCLEHPMALGPMGKYFRQKLEDPERGFAPVFVREWTIVGGARECWFSMSVTAKRVL